MRAGARAVSLSMWSSVAAAVAAIGLLWMPIHWSVGPLQSADDAKEFLQTLWQVEAAILALSLAVLFLAFEAFSAARSSQTDSFIEFAAETQLLLVSISDLRRWWRLVWSSCSYRLELPVAGRQRALSLRPPQLRSLSPS
jgi:hypothetical protein